MPSLLLLTTAAATAAGPIAITNPRFELDPEVPTKWNVVAGTATISDLQLSGQGEADPYAANARGFEDTRACFLSQGGTIRQTLAAKLEPNTTYTLSVASGTRSKGAFGGYSITLDTTSGALVGSWRGVNHNIAKPGTFADTSRSFTTGPNPPGAGEGLRITLAQANSQTGENAYTDLDDIRLTAAPADPRPAKCPVDVFFVAGQSNAHGWKADAAALGAANRHYADAPDPRALLAYAERNLPEPIDNLGSPGLLGVQGAGFGGYFSGFGPELSTGSDLAAALKGRVAMIKYAVGSAGLEQNFIKTGPTRKPHYEAMLDHFRTSLDELKRQGFEPRLKGFFWLQGETDSGGEEAARYDRNITRFIADLRADLGAPELRFFLTEINDQMPALKPRSGTAQVNEGMQACAKADPLVRFIPTSDLSSGFADAIHYSADQEIMIGQRWAKAWLEAK